MRIPPQALLAGGLLLIAAVIAGVIVLSGRDDDDPAVASTATPTPVSADDWGPDPVMTEHIHAVSPEHKGKIQQAQTVERPDRSAGICVEVSYEGLPQNNLSFQMAIGGGIVTDKLTVEIIEGTLEAPERGRLCYASPEGLDLGVHDAAVAVQDPNNLSGPPSEVVGWKFEVIE